MLNNLILIGRLASDPELKTLEDGKKVSEITLAIQRPFKNMEGEYDVDFIRATLWAGLAEITEPYLKKGVMIALKARIQTYKYQVTDDKKLTMLEIIGDKVTYLQPGSRNKDPNLDET